MKGVVFSLKRLKSKNRKNRKRLTFSDIAYFIKRYWLMLICITLLLTGLAAGSVYAQNAGQAFLNSLDFLFTTNFDVRLTQSIIGTFCACFASDFIFLFAVFLLGLAPWGLTVLPFVLLFKGFGTGLTAGYLFTEHALKGIGFYLLILLPGTFLFCVALVLFSTAAFGFSKQMLLAALSRDMPKLPLRPRFTSYSSQAMSALIMTFLSAVLDSILWTLLAGVFNF
ncbi:MAG: hypothetical protein LUF33_04095 [Clostridiales bacterium]|nr:hypothetical protein [Clostridiales bacterium]